MISGTPARNVLEGNWDKSWVAILRFPSLEMTKTSYNSSNYNHLKELRINKLIESGLILLFEGL